jgi:hypothetical protein
VNLARQGVPTLVICTEPFEPLARALVSAAGDVPVSLLVLPHPLLSRTVDEVVALVEARRDELDAWAAAVESAESAGSAVEEGT